MNNEDLGLALKMEKVGKRFPGTLAVDSVDFEVYAGEVHALVGENGAGKSTLMKILAGSFNDYTGKIYINNKEVALHSPAIAKKYGIGMIYQELSLAKPISIAENILAGHIPKKGIFIDKKALKASATMLMGKVGLDLNPDLPIEDISQHEAQLVEIAKVMGTNPCILVMDEPTSALSREEVERLFSIIDVLKKKGLAIVYISHHLQEIFRVADRVTVMRDGKKVATKKIEEISREEIVQMMVGKSVKEFYKRQKRDIGEIRLKVSGLSRWGFFHKINFEAHYSEILGICGLSGAGRSELARVLVGLDPADEGKMELDGEVLKGSGMEYYISKGIGYLTEDRKSEGLALRLSVEDNILVTVTKQLARGLLFNKKLGAPKVSNLIKALSLYPPDPLRPVGNLSGGNQQKVLLAKWLASEPKVLILDEPTRGVDINAKMIIHEAIEKLAEKGTTIILISSDLPELVGLSDRVLIMRKGHFIKDMPYEQCTEETVLLAANGEGL